MRFESFTHFTRDTRYSKAARPSRKNLAMTLGRPDHSAQPGSPTCLTALGVFSTISMCDE